MKNTEPTSTKGISAKALGLLFAVGFLVTGVLAAPASLIKPFLDGGQIQIEFQEITGTLWRGRIERLSVSGSFLGDIAFTIQPAALLTGRASADLSVSGGPAIGSGQIGASLLRQRVLARDVEMEFNLNSITDYSLFGIPYQGRMRAKIDRLVLSRRGCILAEGEVWTDALDATSQQFLGDGLSLSGTLQCDDDRLAIDLSGANTKGETEIAIKVAPDMTYQISAVVRPREAQLNADLQMMGFESENGALVYDAVGELKGVGS
ncbi:MAG: type II secretion system protein N [Pseudomonadota bacterium]